MWGYKAYDWKTIAKPLSEAGILLTSFPSIKISPDVILSNPAIILNNVDLPHPEGPTKTRNFPLSTFKSTPWITSVSS